MNLSALLDARRISINATVSSKKRVLEHAAELLSQAPDALNSQEIFASLIARERLGSTGLGNGIAVPHGRVKSSNRPVAALIRLANGIEFDAVDGAPVDLMFCLIIPESSPEAHLDILATLARMFSDNAFCARLRAVDDRHQAHALLTQWDPTAAGV